MAEMAKKSYQDLVVWQRAVDLSVVIYGISKGFPSDERFGLTSQLRRASVSVASNIAEGCVRNSPKEFAQFLSIALGSMAELKTQMIIANKIGYVTEELYNPLLNKVDELGAMLNGLKKSLLVPTNN